MRRAAVLVLSLAGLLVSLFLSTRSGPSETPTIEQLLEPRDLKEIARFRALFGIEGDMVLVALRRPGGVIGKGRLGRVEEELSGIEGVKGTWSSLSRPRLFAEDPDGPPAPPPTLLEPDASSRVIVVAIEEGSMGLSRARTLVASIDAALARVAEEGETVHVLGGPNVRVASWDVVTRDLGRMLPLLALVVAAVPILFFAAPGAALFPLVLAALTTGVTLLGYRLAEGPLDALVLLLLPMLWSTATLDAMHVYAQVRRRGKGSEAALALPCFLTSVTTAGGLLALAAPGAPRLLASFGLWAGAGTGVAYVLTFTLGGVMLGPSRGRRTLPRWPGRFAATLVRLSERHRRVVLASWALVLVAAAVLSARIRAEVRYPDIFAADEPVARELRDMQELLGTDLMPLEICVEPTDDHGHRPVALANAVLAVSHYVRTLPETRYVLPRDLLDVGAPGPGAERPGALDAAIARLAEDPKVAPWVRFDKGAARVQVHFARTSFSRRDEILSWLRHFDATMLSHHRLSLGGPCAAYQLAESRGVRGTLVDGWLSLLVVVGSLAWAFRGRRVLLAAIVGNVAPVLLVTGLMGALGVPWSLALLPLPAVLVGLAVDDTFHLLWPLRGRKGPSRLTLARSALRAGPPALATSAVLAFSVSTLALSGLATNRELGLLLGAGLGFALLCDLSLVPAILGVTTSRRRSAR